MQDLKKDLLRRGHSQQRRPSHRLSWRSRLLTLGQVSVTEDSRASLACRCLCCQAAMSSPSCLNCLQKELQFLLF